ncbi:hypothetical protein MBLNU457_4718t1 [Dothideomycetes sp. NU457]
MDLNSMMNPSSGSGGRISSTKDQERSVPPQRSSSGTSNDYPGVQQHRASSNRPTPNYAPPAPPPLDTRSAIVTNTPHRTPSGYPSSEAQYPFPATYQSPSVAHQDRFPAVTPGGRNPAQYYQPPLASPGSGFQPPGNPHSASISMTSRTPTSTHSQSPHTTRESPYLHQSLSHHSLPYSHHGSQPSTPQGVPQPPLGPPPSQYNRIPSHGPPNVHSPYALHHRSYSGASIPAGRASHSPAQANIALGHIADSPATYVQPSDPCKRLSNDYTQNNGDRERSLSVSPKTRVFNIPPSRQNSQGNYPTSARSSFAEARPMSSERIRAPVPPYNNQTPSLPRVGTETGVSAAASPISQSRGPVSMQHLLSEERPSVAPSRPSLDAHRSSSIEQPQSTYSQQPPPPSLPTHQSSTGTSLSNPAVGSPTTYRHSQPPAPGLTTPLTLQQPLKEQTESVHQDMAKKRRAEESPEETRAETKKQRKVYPEPPIWARLGKFNPRYNQQTAAYPNLASAGWHATQPQPQSTLNPQIRTPHQAPKSSPQPQTNGHPPGPPAMSAPTSSDQPYNSEKSKVTRLLGMPWEVSITDSKPIDPVLRSVLDFLFYQLVRRPHIETADIPMGAFEIEAKLGILVDRGTKQRLNFPNTTAMVLDQGFSARSVAFESFMGEEQHKTMNQFLNDVTGKSMGPGRTKMHYQHRYERDSFAPLSQAGNSALPEFAHRIHEERQQRAFNFQLRTSEDVNPKLGIPPNAPHPVLARIIKLRLADLDILSAFNAPYDMRLSVNIEFDMTKCGLDVQDLVVPPATEKDRQPVRHKNRLSYSHLGYQIDLTQVSVEGESEKKHELEVEVDAVRLREQALMLLSGRESAFEELVEGLLSDCRLLMRVKEENSSR